MKPYPRSHFDAIDVVIQRAPACSECGHGEGEDHTAHALDWRRVGGARVTWLCEACDAVNVTNTAKATITTYGRAVFFTMPRPKNDDEDE